MRRSLLFIPANSPAMLQNADVFAADGVIFDLEDAVTFSQKDAAVHLLANFLQLKSVEDAEIIVRINDLESSFFQKELSLLINADIDTIMLPKATCKTTKTLANLLEKLEKTNKVTKKISIIPIIELASSVFEVNEIAKIERVNGLLLGAEDLTTDLEAQRTEAGLEILLHRSMVVLAARANKIDAIDTPYTNIENSKGLIKDCQLAKQLGMNAKVCIHPNQIDDVNTQFSPSHDEIKQALKIIKATRVAGNMQKGAFSLDGKMIDKPIIQRAEKLLEKAKQWKLI